ncbi:MAG: hypothetical protein AAF340_18105 [Pseudomonadota bacterium]
MAMTLLTYFSISFGALFLLALMITRIGSVLGECPDVVPGFRAAVATICTAFVAIGTGGVFLAAVVVALLSNEAVFALFVGLGVASLCLGLGFTQAIANLRAVVSLPQPASA